MLGFVQGVIFSLITLFKRPKRASSKLISALIFLLAWGCLFDDTVDLQVAPLIHWLWNGNQLLLGPLFYLYIRYFNLDSSKIKANDLWHFAPFVLLKVVAFYFEVATSSTIDFPQTLTFFFGLIPAVHILIYMLMALRSIRQLAKGLTDVFSDKVKGNVNWLAAIALISIASTLFVLTFKLLDSLIFYQLAYLMAVFSIYLFSIKSISYPFLFFDRLEHSEAPSDQNESINSAPAEKYKNSPVVQDQLETIAELTENIIRQERLYLNPELNLVELAERVDVPHHLLTQAINQILGKNFYQLVNEYRVSAFKRKLQDPNNDHLKLLALAFDSGFNTKSSFNRIFKEFTGTTPSAYKKSMTIKVENSELSRSHLAG